MIFAVVSADTVIDLTIQEVARDTDSTAAAPSTASSFSEDTQTTAVNTSVVVNETSDVIMLNSDDE
jgi:hypothetical protein